MSEFEKKVGLVLQYMFETTRNGLVRAGVKSFPRHADDIAKSVKYGPVCSL